MLPIKRRKRTAFKLIELLVVIGIIAVGLFILVPAIQASREAGRRSTCLNNAHQLGLALQNYASTYANALPPSATLYGTGPVKHVGGYSFLVKCLPFMENDNIHMSDIYKLLSSAAARPSDKGVIPWDQAAVITAGTTSLKELVCPSNRNSVFANSSANQPQFALTNYKAMGASTRDSLLMAADSTLKPPYGTAKMHPDGALYPSDKNLPMSDLENGTSNTILVIETMDDTNSRWMVGAECTLVGLPQASSPTGAEPAPPHKIFAPPGSTWGDRGGVSCAGLRSFLTYDFSPNGKEVSKYEDPGWSKPSAYGPSSGHPAVVIVTFADGSVTPLNKQVDAANLFFLITKHNDEPFQSP
jgi:type II secretory pathway pseudopilin PulG